VKHEPPNLQVTGAFELQLQPWILSSVQRTHATFLFFVVRFYILTIISPSFRGFSVLNIQPLQTNVFTVDGNKGTLQILLQTTDFRFSKFSNNKVISP